MNLTSYLYKVTQMSSIEDLWQAHTDQMAHYGFDRILYGYTLFRTKNSMGDPDDFIILSNHSEEFLRHYFDSRRFHNSVMIKWALNNEGSTSWRLAQNRATKGQLNAQEQEVFDFNNRMGVHAGYMISFSSAHQRCKGMIGLTARRDLSQDDVDEIWKEHGTDIVLINNVVHLKIISLPYMAPNRILTKRQREVLQWVGDGKTTQDIAFLMGVTPSTVEKHLRLARKALCVETTAQAVLKAALHNLMYTSDT